MFDEQFPDVEAGFQTEEGMLRAFGAFDCCMCGRRIHPELAVYLCSPDCLSRYQAD